MASTKVIATTWSKKELLAKLKSTIKRMDDEINEWEKNHLTLAKRQAAWDKKAIAWVIKNASKATDHNVSDGYKGRNVTFYFDGDIVEAALGERPEQGRKPQYKDTSYNKEVSDYEQVQNAIALIEGSVDVEYKINTSSVWASFIR